MVVKVLHNFASLNLGGAESRTMDIYRRIDRERINFDFVVYEEDEQYFEAEIRSLGGHVYRVMNPRRNLLKHMWEVRSLLNRNQYDAVHSHTSFHSGLVSLIAWACHVPLRIAHARTSGSMNTHGFGGRLNLRIGQWLTNTFATDLLAISAKAGRFVFGEASKFTVLPNAFNLDDFTLHDTQTELRSSLNLPRNSTILGQVARLTQVKNQKYSIDLLKSLVQKDPQFLLVFIGDGPDKQELQRLAVSQDLEQSIIFAGLQDNISEWLAAFDLLLMPSLYEGLGVAVLEGQAAGIPVVASSGVPESADIGLSLVSFRSLEASKTDWLNAIEKGLATERPTMLSIQQAFAERSFTLDAAVNEITNLYLR